MNKSIYQQILDAIESLTILYARKPLQKEIYYRIRFNGANVSRNTINSKFNHLVNMGYIEKYGNGRGAYRVIKPQYDTE